MNLQIATIDAFGDPNIQPVWFYYDKDTKKLFILTGKMTNKTHNIRKRPNIYFCVEDGNSPYKGVKGKAVAIISEDPKIIISMAEKISLKYLGNLDHPVAKTITDRSKNGEGVAIELDPKFFSTWDFGKM